ncbi:bifunctional DedA family/phosphatase PAP2 family protein [Allohahella marinimesophila]|uniref:Bifunctional DedA family/phosphatase PAP2 family protein n=1 Tax=Allohahella marinimesophila TaxID=1054972 RepID=A0ABP7NF53_9GAMM
MTEPLTALLDWLQANSGWITGAIALTAFAESLAMAGIIVPGVIMLFGFAALAGFLQFDIMTILAAAFVGAVAGDAISFALGRHYKAQTRQLWPLSRYPMLVARGEAFFLRHGMLSIVLGRFIGPIRPIVPMIAGMMLMSPRKFLIVNVLSALAWAPFYIFPGFLTGSSLEAAGFDFSLDSAVSYSAGRPGENTGPVAQLWAFWHLWSPLAVLAAGAMTGALASYLLRAFETRLWLPGTAFLIALLCWTLIVIESLFRLSTIDIIDQSMFNIAQAISIEWVRLLAIGLTLLGDTIWLYILLGTSCVWLWFQGHQRLVVCIALGGLATHALTSGLKMLFDVVRPEVTYLPGNAAYPSGHTSGAVYTYTVLAMLFARKQRWLILCLALATLVGTSRLLLGVHWFSDIVGGSLLGLGTACFALQAARVPLGGFLFRHHRRQKNHAVMACVLVAAAIYVSVRMSQVGQQYLANWSGA